MKLKSLTFVSLFIFLTFNVFAQQKETFISGNVTDEYGLPIPGVEVVHNLTGKGVTTDFEGNYEIVDDFKENSILSFSYVGLLTKQVKVNSQTLIDVQLIQDDQQLNEIVVMGYGSQLRKNVTSAVSTIDGESFESRPNNKIGDLLQGQAAGVQVLSSSGKPSAGFNIRIRGTNSIGSGSDPLYVVDGVPTTDTRSINPTDIESISVLKDASSAAIYGAQGAMGWF